MTVGAPSYEGFHFPAEIISRCVWLYYRFPLSFREAEEMMLQRGITRSHETVRQWCAKFGQPCANALRRRRARPGDRWHLDEVFITINGQRRYLWRAVDQHGTQCDCLDEYDITELITTYREGASAAFLAAAHGVGPVSSASCASLVSAGCHPLVDL